MAAGRFARWWSGWRVAIRIARRDARRYKWRSALIVAMVGLPVLLLTSGITLLATNDVSVAESVPRVMGSAQARVQDRGDGYRLTQSPDSRSAVSSNESDGDGEATNALAVPGFALDSAWTASKVEHVTGGRVIQTTNAGMRVTLGDRRPVMPVLGIDGRDPLARGMTDLVSGRWASTPSEIVVTEAGIADGLPSGGTLTTAGLDGTPRQLTVVGVATGQTEYGELPFLVAQPALVAEISDELGSVSAFLIEQADPVTWSDVRRINNYGLLVQSRQVFLDPPSAAELDPQVAQSVGSYQSGNDLVLLIAAVGLFLETTLLAGPAFAVSAARQRRSLALAASNGAEARQLRRYVLGQAVVLGFVSAAVAVVAGVLLTLAGLTWWQAGHADFATGPLEVSWPRVVGVFVCAIVASMVAALLPAKGIARLDIVSVLAGRSGDRTVHRGLPVAGVIVMLLSGAAIFWSVAYGADAGQGRSEYVVAGGAVVLVVGALMVIPALLALMGRLGTHLVLPMRLATRDTARQRGRSTPAVAAIMATVAALTALSIGAVSDTRQRQLEYHPQLAMGHGRVALMTGQDDKAVRTAFGTYAPDLSLFPVGTVVDVGPVPGRDPVPGSTLDVVGAQPPGCSDAEVFGAFGDGSRPVVERCGRLGAGSQYQQSQIQVVPLESLMATTPVSDAEGRLLRDGGVLVLDPSLSHGGHVEFVTGRTKVGTGDAPPEMPVTTGHQKVPALVIDRKAWTSVLHDQLAGAWVLPATAARLGWPVTPSYLEATSPTGIISAATEKALNEHLDSENTIYVERGFQNDSWLILLILFSVAGLLVLVASLISTALSLAEGQNDMATLAAVGATRHIRRGIAACQALVVAVCGCLLGVAVGMIPGIAITWPLTTQGFDQATMQQSAQAPIIVIPWLPLVAVCVGVPLMAAGLAWVAVRRHPQLTRRLA